MHSDDIDQERVKADSKYEKELIIIAYCRCYDSRLVSGCGASEDTQNPLGDKWSFRENSIISNKRNSNITQAQLATKLNRSDRQIRRAIKGLREKGLIDRVGSRKSGQWIVKSIKNLRRETKQVLASAQVPVLLCRKKWIERYYEDGEGSGTGILSHV